MCNFEQAKGKKKKGANQPLIYIQMRSIQGEIGFSISLWWMNFLVADCIVSSRGVNIQLWASGVILHYKDWGTFTPPLHRKKKKALTIPISVPMFKQYPQGHLRHFSPIFNLHMKDDNISKEFCFKFKRKLVSALCPLCQPARANSVPQSEPAGGGSFCRCNWAQRVYTYPAVKKLHNIHNYTNQTTMAHGKKKIQRGNHSISCKLSFFFFEVQSR